MRTYYLYSLGCPKNLVDSEAMAMLLGRSGYRGVASPDEADVLIVNTCGFLRAAQEESLGALKALGEAKREGQVLVAAGCMVERDGEIIAREVPEVDLLLGTYRWPDIVPVLERLERRNPPHSRRALLGEPDSPWAGPLPRARVTGGSAYLKISDGCNARCAFCTIPSFKGRMKSRPVSDLVAEAKELVNLGAKEIVLVAQDTTDYGRDLGLKEGLAQLVDAMVAEVPEITWLRIMYAYPGRVTPKLIETMAKHPQVCHYLDIPLQHGHPDVLRRMRRPDRVDNVLKTIEHLREAMPDIALRSTFIVGFPGETEEEFQALLDFVRAIEFDWVGAFTFSPEPGTPAAEMPDQVPEEVKEERYSRLMSLQQRISKRQSRNQVGRALDILIESSDGRESVGRSYRDAPEIDGTVTVRGNFPVGEMLEVRITGATAYDLVGSPTDASRKKRREITR
jgi:ribosomal protein S12 methylthiotransferase